MKQDVIRRRRSILPAAIFLLAIFLFPASVSRAQGPRPLPKLDDGILFSRLKSGKLAGIFQRAGAGGPEIMARYSTDNGASWGEPNLLLTLPKADANWGLGEVLVDRNEEFHLFFMITGNNTPASAKGEQERPLIGELVGSRIDIGYVRSSNHGTTWTNPRVLWIGYTGALNSVIQTDTGSILLPFSYLTKRNWGNRGQGVAAFTFMGQYDSTVLHSEDDGATWSLSNSLTVPVPDIVSAYGAVEPVVVQLKDKRVWMLIRTQMGRFWESFSRDGAHWSEPQPTDILSSDSPAGLVRLSDGRIVLFWNDSLRYPYAYGGRQVLHAAISADSGRTWRGYREVGRDPMRNEQPSMEGDFGTAYPFPALANNDTVLFVSGQGKGRILRAMLDPKWLYETTQTANFRDRAEEWSTFGTKGVEIVAAEPGLPGGDLALQLRKPQADWPAAAVWNFPSGEAGKLRLRLQVRPGFGGALIGLTDHFSTPFDKEDRYNNAYNLWIGPDGAAGSGLHLAPGKWHDLELAWSASAQTCLVTIDGRKSATLPVVRSSRNICYLRLASTAPTTDDAGFLVQSVSVDVSSSSGERTAKATGTKGHK